MAGPHQSPKLRRPLQIARDRNSWAEKEAHSSCFRGKNSVGRVGLSWTFEPSQHLCSNASASSTRLFDTRVEKHRLWIAWTNPVHVGDIQPWVRAVRFQHFCQRIQTKAPGKSSIVKKLVKRYTMRNWLCMCVSFCIICNGFRYLLFVVFNYLVLKPSCIYV